MKGFPHPTTGRWLHICQTAPLSQKDMAATLHSKFLSLGRTSGAFLPDPNYCCTSSEEALVHTPNAQDFPRLDRGTQPESSKKLAVSTCQHHEKPPVSFLQTLENLSLRWILAQSAERSEAAPRWAATLAPVDFDCPDVLAEVLMKWLDKKGATLWQLNMWEINGNHLSNR